MNRYPALPREFEDLMTFLSPVDSDRRPAIARMVFEQLAECPICAECVRRCDPRDLTDAGLAHIGCPRRRGGWR